MGLDSLIAHGMTALLGDPDAKKAVLEYLQALTDAARPPAKAEQWKTVWEELSPKTYEVGLDTCRIYFAAKMDRVAGVLTIFATLVKSDFDFKYPKSHTLFDYAINKTKGWGYLWVYQNLLRADHYTDAILLAQKEMTSAVADWERHMKEGEQS